MLRCLRSVRIKQEEEGGLKRITKTGPLQEPAALPSAPASSEEQGEGRRQNLDSFPKAPELLLVASPTESPAAFTLVSVRAPFYSYPLRSTPRDNYSMCDS